MKSKREIERYYFEIFRKIYKVPSGQVLYRYKPDVIIDGKRTVTNFYLFRNSNLYT